MEKSSYSPILMFSAYCIRDSICPIQLAFLTLVIELKFPQLLPLGYSAVYTTRRWR